jgi:hypothetical protein
MEETMALDDLLRRGMKALGDAGVDVHQAEKVVLAHLGRVLDRGFIVKLGDGDYLLGRDGERVTHEKLEGRVEMHGVPAGRPRIDLRGRYRTLDFPITFEYSDLAPLAGSMGAVTIHADGRIEYDRFIVS